MGLHNRQLKAVDLLVYGDMTITDIAKEVGVTRQTIYDWMDNVEFKEVLDSETNKKMEMTRKVFQSDIDKMYKELYNIALNEKTSPRDKISAITYIMNRVYGNPNSPHEIKSSGTVGVTVSEEDVLDAFDRLKEEE